MIVSRTCTEISAGDANQRQDKEARPLEAFRDTPAYVLLGDPGAGKTTAFEAERKALGEQACLIPVRDFLTFDPQDHPEWRGKTLFIDGLDEVRAGSSDARTPFDAIRRHLDALGKPRFRLSCREADWLGTNDRRRLESVSPDAKVTVLRLNPLTDSDIAQLLKIHPDVNDAEAFIAEANERGMDGLLANPQSLDLLARAVVGGHWPESRKETFEMACGQMVREHNEEHQAAMASSSPPTPDQLLDAAGRLCAVQLIAGMAGYTLHGQPDNEYPALDQCGGDHPDRLRLALANKLFKGVSDNRFISIHRHVAEFLGARYLARVINGGLPARRVIALITGADGAVVTESRSLSAWLAAHCQEARLDLIERDPIGVGLYGDIQTFSSTEKSGLLNSLKREGSRIEPHLDPQNDSPVNSMERRAAIFSALDTPSMEPAFREILAIDEYSQDHQLFTDFVLRILVQGSQLPRLAERLLEVVHDDARLPRVKEAALSAFIHNCPDSQCKVKKLKALLADIQTGRVSDSSDRLFGILLTTLYPDEVTPSEIWSYFSKQGSPEPFGRLRWLWEIVDKSSDKQVAELLDDLQQRFSELRPALELHHIRHLPLKLLARGLGAYGDQLDAARLYDWLGVGEFEYAGNSGEGIRFWLEQRPEVQKAVILEGLNRCPDSDEFWFHSLNVLKRLHGASLPPDFGRWCLEQAVVKADTKPRVSEYLFERAFYWVGGEGLSLQILRKHAQKHERLKACLDGLLASRSRREEQDLKHREWERTFTEERQEEEEKWLAHVRSNEAALRENRAAPALLFQLAEVYFGINSTDHGPEGVEKALQGDHQLTQAALQGFRGTVERQDVPTFEEILGLRAEDHEHYLALPFLAGLAEIERTCPEDASRWDDNRIRKAITFYFSYAALLSDERPDWYQRLLAVRPRFVAEVQVRVAVSEFRSGREHVGNLWELAHDKDHTEVAKHASLPLLRAFPTRCKLKQLRSLDHTLWAAIQHADRMSLRKLIERKLSLRSMNDAQHVHWLAAGFAVAPDAYQTPLSDFVQGREQRIRHLAEFFCQDHVPSSWFDALGIPGLARFIRLVGGYVGPELMNEQGLLTPVMEAARLVHDLIQRLSASPDKHASEALDSLLEDSMLYRWHKTLSHARDTQRIIRRDADYRHPTIEQVCQTLKGGTAANPGDLAALVMDRLEELTDRIRKGNTDDWRQYWDGLRGQSPTPKHEEDCRDALLSDLQQRLPQGIDAQPEGQYANDKRADIRVSYGGFQVPVEVKKNTHRDVWSALRNQLIAQYVSDPETDGYGIYLVFWFGKQCTQAPPSGQRPADAETLKERLEAKLSADEVRKISICVIDVSKP